MMTRRDCLKTFGTGFGMTAFAGLFGSSMPALGAMDTNPLAPKAPHFPAKAKHVIFLFLNGGPSQVDTFDPKPMLDKYNGKPVPSGNLKTERKTGNLLKSPFEFKKHGESGIEVSEIFPKLGARIDDCCVIRSMYTDRPNHEPSLLLMNTGDKFVGRPSMGSWLTYGLGSENQNLPGFVVMCPGFPVIGPQLWASTFLPAVYQGTYIPNGEKTPDKLVQYIHNSELSSEEQRRQLDLLDKLNEIHLQRAGQDPRARSEYSVGRNRLPDAVGSARSVRHLERARKSAGAIRRKRLRARVSDVVATGRKGCPDGADLLRQFAAVGQPRRHSDPPQTCPRC